MTNVDFNELFSKSKKVTPGGVHSPVRSFKGIESGPIFFSSASGSKLYDMNNREYLDLCSSFGPLLLGHRDPDVEEAVKGVIGKVWSFGAPEPYSLELASYICDHLPWIDKIRFVSSGTEAVMSALRLARGATNRSMILKFDGCYHGHVDSMLVKSGSGLAGVGESSSAGVSEQTARETLVAPLNDKEAVKDLFKQYPDEIAAIIIEPLPANYGLLKQSQDYLEFLRETCDENGSLLIFDEVISGFRVAFGGMAEVTGITPDIVTYGKIIGGGFPVGAFAGKKEVMNFLAPDGPVYQAGTLSANPVSMVAGLATLKKIKSTNANTVASEKCHLFSDKVNQIFNDNDIHLTCHRDASLFFIAKEKHLSSPHQFDDSHAPLFQAIYPQLLDKGIYMAPAAFEVGFFSSVITDEEALRAAEVLGQAFVNNLKSL